MAARLPSTDYLRLARRLRARLADDLPALHQSLQLLADRQDGHAAFASLEEFPSQQPEDYFARMVRAVTTGPVLTYSARRNLLNQAARLGISRFHANLVIARVAHEVTLPGNGQAAAVLPGRYRLLGAISVALALQGAILLGGWMIFS